MIAVILTCVVALTQAHAESFTLDDITSTTGVAKATTTLDGTTSTSLFDELVRALTPPGCMEPILLIDGNLSHLQVIALIQSPQGCEARFPDAPCLGQLVALLRPDGSYSYKVGCTPKADLAGSGK
jgi:hypothetical protein